MALKVMKPGKAAGPSEVCAEMISASGEVGASVMVELCQRVLDGKGMANKCAGTNFQGKEGCKKLQYLQRSKAVRARHEDR